MASDLAPADELLGVMPEPPSPWWTGLRVGLVALLVALGAALLVLGERPADLASLEAALQDGRVGTVEIENDLPPGATGTATAEAHWRDGWTRHVTTVTVVHDDQGDGDLVSDGGDVITTMPSLTAELRSIDPDLRIEHRAVAGWSSTVLDRGVPGWLAGLVTAQWVASLVVLVAGPQPWRATRWAWFWLLNPPVGVLAFLLLSGPTPGLPRPRGRRRLTAGWAFLLNAILGMLLSSPWWS